MKSIHIKIALLFFLLVNCTVASYSQTGGKNIDGVIMLPSKNAFNNLSANPNYSIFVNAIKAAGLTNTFSGKQQITVLAPNNKAFAKLAPGTLDTLFHPQNLTQLSAIVNSHAFMGKITTADIAQRIKAGNGSARLTTMAGTTLTATINANRNIVLSSSSGEQAIISRFNATQSNGTLHTVTIVLMPLVL